MAASVRGLVLGLIVVLPWPGHAGEVTRRGRLERVVHVRARDVVVPAGSFTMGFPALDPDAATVDGVHQEAIEACLADLGEPLAHWCIDERQPYRDAQPAREVFLPAFAIDRHEVTVAAYRRCVATGACDVAPLVQGDQRYTESALPVVNVTWQDAVDYCGFGGGRLPTEAEWERAARGTDGRPWPWGRAARPDDFNHGAIEDPAVLATHQVNQGNLVPELRADPDDGALALAAPGSEPWSESPVGVHDLAGNVAEWVADYYAAAGYDDLPRVAPSRLTRADGLTERVVRGASWLDPPHRARTYARDHAEPTRRAPTIGFRCARDLAR